MENLKTNDSASETVLAFIEALNNEEFEKAGRYLAPDMQFKGVLGSRDGAAAYMADMQKMKFKYAVKKVFADDNDVCLFYDLDMGGGNVLGCGWYHTRGSKISLLTVLFDPRPVLEKKK